MDQLRIGKFIADCRKEKKLTQMQLAEKLGITDKAISKWERGIAMPDSSIMLELCGILDISVNELLSGEKINMEETEKKTEELLLELTAKDEKRRKKLFVYALALTIVIALFSAVVCGLACVAIESKVIAIVVVIVGYILATAGLFFTATMEMEAGRYICKHCGHEFEASSPFAMFKIGFGTPKNWRVRLKCPECGKKSWTKRVLPK